MYEIAEVITKSLSTIVELVAAFIITVALVKFLYMYIKRILHPHQGRSNQYIRIHFGSSLTIALELLLAADILETAIAPTWDEIGKLAAIAAIRTALNFFLEKELNQLEEKSNVSE
jgi:uncharacterized membrane protein